jgi:hypothetical protein
MAEGEFSIATLLAQLNTVIQVIREEIPPERWDYVIARLEDKDITALPPTVVSDEFEEIIDEQRKFSAEEDA